jgi:hypothetical protein
MSTALWVLFLILAIAVIGAVRLCGMGTTQRSETPMSDMLMTDEDLILLGGVGGQMLYDMMTACVLADLEEQNGLPARINVEGANVFADIADEFSDALEWLSTLRSLCWRLCLTGSPTHFAGRQARMTGMAW